MTPPAPDGDPYGLRSLSLDWLRAKPGQKWARHPGELAAWVADMDFLPPPAVRDALTALADGGDFGYPDWRRVSGGSPAEQAFVERCRRLYGWQVASDALVEFAEVVQGLQVVLHTSTKPGDRVVVPTPVYPPFLRSLAQAGCEVVPMPAERDAESPTGWGFDVDALDRQLAGAPARMMMLSHPHNPTGHVHDEAELRALAAVAERHDLLILSDEIHAELTFAPHRHVPMAMIAPERTVTITSPSKAFNIAGLRYAIGHFGDRAALARVRALPDHVLGSTNLAGVAAATAAWRDSDEWLAAVMAVLADNRLMLADLLTEMLPEVLYTPPAASYLAWLDCRRLGFGDDPSVEFARRGVRLNPGPTFGVEGRGFARLNMATSPDLLRQIATRMATG